MLVLERLSDAVRGGRRVLALVRGSAVNQDGASNGLTAPNGPSQERVIRRALESAGLAAVDVDAVEAHGTGTTLGDPIEAQALLSTYGRERAGGPLYLGSIKSNIGHTQAAAGVAGVIKMVMALRGGLLPRSLFCEEPSGHVDWSAGDVRLLSEEVEWARGERPRRAGVSSFGISGTNAHVILEEAPAVESSPGAVDGGGVDDGVGVALVLSARGDKALGGQASRLRDWLLDRPGVGVGDLAFSLVSARARLEQRAVVLGDDREELVAGLDHLARGEDAANVLTGRVRPGKTAFLFTGQGSQWPGMGAGLCERFAVFAGALEEVCGELDRYLERPLREVMFAEKGSASAALLDRTEFTQVALFALEIALYRFRSVNVRPDFLIGHSIGEFAAAHVAGVFSLADGCRLVAERARLMGALPEGGAMLALQADEQEVRESLGGQGDGLSVAAVNGRGAVVLSGELDAILEAERSWRSRGRKTSRLKVSHAFHSSLMEPMLKDFAAVAREVGLREPMIPIISNETGEPLSAQQACSPQYWVRHLRETVRFADGVDFLLDAGATRFVELGPDGVLSAMAHAATEQRQPEERLFAAAMRPNRDQARSLTECLAEAHTHGVDVDWGCLFEGARVVDLPTYAFQRERFWIEGGRGAGDLGAVGLLDAEHPLLGAAVRLAASEEWLFTGSISLNTHPWLKDHAVAGVVLVPGMLFVELAFCVARRLGVGVVDDLTLVAPLVVGEGGGVALQVVVSDADEQGRRPVNVYSCSQGPLSLGEFERRDWVLHASGLLGGDGGALEDLGLAGWPPVGARECDVESFYERAADAGYEYGPAFQGLRRAYRDGDVWHAEVALGEDERGGAGGFCVHPALSDAALHVMLLAALEDGGLDGSPQVPFSFSGVRLFSEGASALRVRLEISPGVEGEGSSVRVVAVDESGMLVFVVDGLRSRAIDQAALRVQVGAGQDVLFAVDWVEVQDAAPGGGSSRVVSLGRAGLGGWADELECFESLGALSDAITAGETQPDVVLAPVVGRAGGQDVARAAHELTEWTLLLLQRWVQSEALAQARLVFLTNAALALAEDESPNLAQTALVGLVRSAASENPGRVSLIDLDTTDASRQALQNTLTSQEPEIALRNGTPHTPRLTPMAPHGRDVAGGFGGGTVLVTGGTGGLGVLVARHLAGVHGVRRLVLVSRGGGGVDGVGELVASLAELGCEARVVACDVANRAQLEGVLGEVDAEYPLTGVVHAAGVLDDGVVGSLDGERLKGVMAPKVDGAVNLHELTKGLSLSRFVLFSSIASTLGAPGQGNYAAANAFLDGLAHVRRAEGLPAVSIAWGAWERGMVSALDRSDRARGARSGVVAFSDEQGLDLFDVACVAARPVLVPVRLDLAALRARARDGTLPVLLSGLARVSARRVAEGSLAQRLAGVPQSQWQEVVLKIVKAHVAGVLGHSFECSDRFAASLQGPRVRLAERRRATKPLEPSDRAQAPHHPHLRLHQPHRSHPTPDLADRGRQPRNAGSQATGRAGRRADRDRGDERALPGGRALAGGSVAAGGGWPGCGRRVPG